MKQPLTIFKKEDLMSDFRYKMQHMGDIVVGSIEKAAGSARECAKGVVLTYDIHETRKKRRHLLRGIGRRLVQLKKEGLTDVKRDDGLVELFAELDSLEKTLKAYEEERNAMVHPCRARLNPAESAS